MSLQFTVLGTPAPQGSKKGFQHPTTGRVVVVEQQNRRVKSWREDVKHAAVDALAGRSPAEGPLEVTIVFRLQRPQAHYGRRGGQPYLKPTAPAYVDRMPDLDKLERATLDALTAAGVWRDDGQVARLMTEKVYADPGIPGADITVAVLSPISVSAASPSLDPIAAGTDQPEGALW